ncbi:haloalkane dehalogenase [Rhizobium leguminosarum]|uniref:haloalkane dehalogenase n=1 Tax=Rhizobium leguminosarum TaxID=384 RepID=UPI000FEC9668|nr:haloalkane dehalogenase [Rhizobium leguminosarum]RWX12886.1 haloalkane dehalogenase [Rhizobium leguminosarum]
MLDPKDKKRIQINGLSLAYHDIGSGDPIVFLHGNPASSFIWRNLIPYAQPYGRCIAPDLIGMGDSDKIPDSNANSYTFAQNREFLDGFFDALGLNERVTLVVHDWGSSLGFDWARRHPEAIKGIIHMEALIAPIEWEDMPEAARPRFRAVRSEQGEELVLKQNIFIEQSIVKGTLRPFSDAEMAEYRRPFLEAGEGRRPMLTWPRQIPIAGEPADVVEVFEQYGAWLAQSEVPKLYVRAEPGTHAPKLIAQVRSWPNQTEIAVKGIHYPQEDSPDEVGAAIATWFDGLAA